MTQNISGEWSFNFSAWSGGWLVYHIILLKSKVSYEIEAYVETHICELRRYFDGAYQRPYPSGNRYDSCGILRRVYNFVVPKCI